MRHVTAHADIAAPAGRVWDLVADFEHWPRWGPMVRAVETDARRVAPGAQGRIKTVTGVWLPFRIDEVAPGRFWSWEVAGIPATGHRVSPLNGNTTRVEFTVPWIAAPYRVVLRRALRNLTRIAAAP